MVLLVVVVMMVLTNENKWWLHNTGRINWQCFCNLYFQVRVLVIVRQGIRTTAIIILQINVKTTIKVLASSVYPGVKDYNKKKALLGEID